MLHLAQGLFGVKIPVLVSTHTCLTLVNVWSSSRLPPGYSLVDAANFVGHLAEWHLPQLVDGAPETDVLVTELLSHAGRELVQAGGVGDGLLHGDGPPAHPTLRGKLDTGERRT